MTGLLQPQQPMQGQMPQAQPGQMPQGQPMQEPMPQGQPGQQQKPMKQTNDQEAFDQFIINGMNILYSDKFTERAARKLSQTDDPAEAIGMLTQVVVERVETAASDENYQLNANVVLNAMNVLMGEVINIAETVGVPKMNDEQKFQALSWAISQYIGNGVERGDITPEDLVSLGEQMTKTPEGNAIVQQIGGA